MRLILWDLAVLDIPVPLLWAFSVWRAGNVPLLAGPGARARPCRSAGSWLAKPSHVGSGARG